METAAAIFGWPDYYLPFLVRAGHLKPLGKPAQNARKWIATVEIERMSCDPDWLDKAVHIVEEQIQEMNKKQRGEEQSDGPLVQRWRRHLWKRHGLPEKNGRGLKKWLANLWRRKKIAKNTRTDPRSAAQIINVKNADYLSNQSQRQAHIIVTQVD